MKIRLNRHSKPRPRRRASPFAAALVLAALSFGCGASAAYRGGQKSSDKGDWDLAVARFTKALTASPRNIRYKIALENAKIQASRVHAEKGLKQVQTGNLEKAMEEYRIAVGFDPSNRAAADDLVNLKTRIDKLAADKRQVEELNARRPADAMLPVPLLSPRSPVPIKLSMTASLEKVYQTLGTLAGVNVVFDPDMPGRDKIITSNLTGVSFQEALDQIGLINKKGYHVLDRNTILIIDDTNAQTRQRWDDQIMRTFYLANIDAKDLEAVLRTTLGPAAKVTKNDATNAITVISTPDEMALADRFIRSNDKPKGEILVEVEIMEINRTNAKEYGLQLSNYQVGVELQPTGVEGEVSGGLTNLRAHLLSSLNASDWVVQIPSALFSKFMHDDSIVKILSAPKIRAFEGEKAIFKIGTEVPIPQFFPGYAANAAPGQPSGGYGGTTSATYKTVGVNLEIDKAKVTGATEVTMKIKAEFSLIGEDKVFGVGLSAINYPQFLTRSVENTLRVTDGVTVVIGGMLTERESRSVKGALGVGSIPVLNKILGGQQRKDEEIEILISLTPHILRAPSILSEDVEPLYLGLRNNLRIPGVRPLFGPDVVVPEVVAPEGETPPPTQTPPRLPLSSPSSAESGATEPSSTLPAPIPSPSPSSPPGPLASRSAWDRTEVQMKVGEVQHVAVNLFNAQSVKEVAIAVRADSTMIEFVEIGPGQLLSVDGVQILTERRLERVRATAEFKRITPLAGGTGTVAIVGFRATRPGEVTIFVENLSLSSGTTQSPVPLAGAVRVTVRP